MRRTLYALILALVLPACDGIEGPEQDGKGGAHSPKGEMKAQEVSGAALEAVLDACSEEEDEGVAANCVEDVLANEAAAVRDGGDRGDGGASKKGEM